MATFDLHGLVLALTALSWPPWPRLTSKVSSWLQRPYPDLHGHVRPLWSRYGLHGLTWPLRPEWPHVNLRDLIWPLWPQYGLNGLISVFVTSLGLYGLTSTSVTSLRSAPPPLDLIYLTGLHGLTTVSTTSSLASSASLQSHLPYSRPSKPRCVGLNDFISTFTASFGLNNLILTSTSTTSIGLSDLGLAFTAPVGLNYLISASTVSVNSNGTT